MGNNTDWPKLMVIVSIIALIAGIALIFYARSEQKLADDSKEIPEEITLQKLIARGPNGNNNVILTHFAVCDNCVYEHKNGNWTCAWVPIVPSENVPPGQNTGGSPLVIHAMIKSPKAKNMKDLEQRCNKARLRGMVINKINTLSSDARYILEGRYTGTNFDTCIIIEEGREPSSQGHIQVLRMLGIILIPISVGGCFLAGYLKVGGRRRNYVSVERRPKKKKRYVEDEDSPRKRAQQSRDDDAPRARRRADEDEDRDDDRRERRRDDDERESPPPRSHRSEEDDDRDAGRKSEGIDPETGRHRRRRRDDD